ncbi:MAG: L-threonine 3-dehydrogenase [Bacillota bacterium]
MKAVVKHAPGPGAGLTEVKVPSPGPGQILIKVKATSICGSDYHIYTWNRWAQERVKPPLVLGHEFAGQVVETGPGVSMVGVGDLVSAETHVVCGRCYQCRTGNAHACHETAILGVDMDGTFAEYVVLPEENAWVNPPDLPPEVASVQEPFGNAVHTVLAGPVAGCTVAVLGCGPIGLCAVAIAKACGAARVYASDINLYRLDLARTMGADVTIRADQADVVRSILEDTGGHGVDVVLEMSGAVQVVAGALKMVRRGGRVSLLGIPSRPVELDLAEDLVMKGVTVQGIAGRRMYETWYQTRALLSSGQVDIGPLITHKFRLEEFDRGMDLMGSGECGKVVLYP